MAGIKPAVDRFDPAILAMDLVTQEGE